MGWGPAAALWAVGLCFPLPFQRASERGRSGRARQAVGNALWRAIQSGRVWSSPASRWPRLLPSSWLMLSEACSLPFHLHSRLHGAAAHPRLTNRLFLASPLLPLLPLCFPLSPSLFLRLLAAAKPQAGALAVGQSDCNTHRVRTDKPARDLRPRCDSFTQKPFLASTPRQSFEIQTSYRPSDSATPLLPSDNQPTVHCYTEAITPLLPTLPTLRARHPVQHRHRLSRPIRPSEPPHRFRQFVSSIAPRKATTRPILVVAHQSSTSHSSPAFSTTPLSLILEVSQFRFA